MAGNNRNRARSRALKEEGLVNFKSFQDNQIDALAGIAKALEDTSKITVSVRDSIASIQKSMEDMQNVQKTSRDLASERLHFESQLNRRREELEKKYGEARMRHIRLEEDAINQARESLKDAVDSLDTEAFDRARLSVEDFVRAEDDRISDMEENQGKIDKVVNLVVNKLVDLAKAAAETANAFSKTSNDLIKVSGASGDTVRSTRNDIVQGIVGQLNSETGYLYNPTDAYQKMVDIANQANIGNLEALEEVTRTTLLASETTNLDESELAKLLNKWYSRYNFSSAEMEGLLDDIRGYTAGNNASAEAVLQNISSLENWMTYYAGGDTEKLSEWTESITKGSAWLESMNVDSSRYTEYIKKLLSGEALTDTSFLALTGYSGYGASDLQQMAYNGDYENLYRILLGAESSMAEGILSNTDIKNRTAGAFGLSDEDLISSYNATTNNQNFVDLEDFIADASDAQTAAEAADQKFVTWSDKVTHYLNGIYESVAKWQENAGIALTDILTVAGGILAVSMGGKITGAISSKVGSLLGGVGANAIGGAAGGAGTAGLGISAGALATAGGALAGGAMAFDGISGALDEGATTGSRVLSGVEAAGGIAGAGALIALGASNPIGWVALAVGGIAFLGKKAYEYANSLDAETQRVLDDIQGISDSFQEENNARLDAISELSYNFNRADSLAEKEQLMRESGLFNEDTLRDQTEDSMKALIESYQNTVLEMDSMTERVSNMFQEDYAEKSDTANEEFVELLSRVATTTDDNGVSYTDTKTMEDLLYLMKPYVNDEELLGKINEALEDPDSMTIADWNDILSSGKSSIASEGVEYAGMMRAVGYLENKYGDEIDFHIPDPATSKEATELATALLNSLTEEEYEAAYDAIKNSSDEVQDLIKEELGSGYYRRYKPDSYATGSNYIDNDQLAHIHEGEAVVPKKYNPAANVTELEMLRKYYRDSSVKENAETLAVMREMTSTLSEIKEFLSYWRDDNIQRESINKRRTPSSIASYISQYMQS